MITAGLTGGIATGKSTVAGFFRDAGAVLIDADRIAREVVGKALPAWRGIVDHFGPEILQPDGDIDREKLGNIIFNSPGEKRRLNEIVHPFVYQEMNLRIREVEQTYPDAVVIQDIPLLIETGMDTAIPRVIVVYVPESIQLRRLMKRNSLSEKDALARIRSQMPIEEKRRVADWVIDNSSSLAETRRQTRTVYGQLLQEAGRG